MGTYCKEHILQYFTEGRMTAHSFFTGLLIQAVIRKCGA